RRSSRCWDDSRPTPCAPPARSAPVPLDWREHLREGPSAPRSVRAACRGRGTPLPYLPRQADRELRKGRVGRRRDEASRPPASPATTPGSRRRLDSWSRSSEVLRSSGKRGAKNYPCHTPAAAAACSSDDLANRVFALLEAALSVSRRLHH